MSSKINIKNPVADRKTGEIIPAASLLGISIDGWFVENPCTPTTPDPTGGTNSYGYCVVHEESGIHAHLKALDYHHAMQADDVPAALNEMTERFLFERRLLEALCNGAKLSRIVRILHSGGIDIDTKCSYPHVDFIVFERADGDLRDVLKFSKTVDDVWRLNCLKDVSAALRQLHQPIPRVKDPIAHCDLKPSNSLWFQHQARTKIGDLGSATGISMAHPHADVIDVFNDPAYSPPEVQYGFFPDDWRQRFLSLDLYLLGNLAVFLLDGYNNLTAEIIGRLPLGMRATSEAGNWMGNFHDILPHLENKFAMYLGDLESRLSDRLGNDIAAEIVDIVRYLSCPNPYKRGHPKARASIHGNPYDLEKVVSAFSLLTVKARARLKTKTKAA
ncbi:MAG: protein kinase family protein [Rhodospirillales bacterium]|jgi:eukaryotic-like serine/threonine-protein kinase|nr:protein kinase family protein [Rhodospirillales bacterium]